MSHALTSLLGYLVNSLWQLPLIYFTTTLLIPLIRKLGPSFVHRVWVVVLGLEIVVPALPRLPYEWLGALARSFWAAICRPFHPAAGSITIRLGEATTTGIRLHADPLLLASSVIWTAATVYFVGQLLWHLARLRRMRLRSRRDVLPAALQARWNRHRRHFQVPRAQIAVSDDVSGPATTGVLRPLVLVPADFVRMSSGEDQDAALAHECAHAARRDFAKHLLYELLSLPLAYHPVRHLTLTRIAETREIVCDALAARAVAGRQRYAESLLRLAAAVLAAKPASNPPRHRPLRCPHA